MRIHVGKRCTADTMEYFPEAHFARKNIRNSCTFNNNIRIRWSQTKAPFWENNSLLLYYLQYQTIFEKQKDCPHKIYQGKNTQPKLIQGQISCSKLFQIVLFLCKIETTLVFKLEKDINFTGANLLPYYE